MVVEVAGDVEAGGAPSGSPDDGAESSVEDDDGLLGDPRFDVGITFVEERLADFMTSRAFLAFTNVFPYSEEYLTCVSMHNPPPDSMWPGTHDSPALQPDSRRPFTAWSFLA